MRQFDTVAYIKYYFGYYFAELQYLFIALLWPLKELWDTYESWRDNTVYKVNLSQQVISIEGNLNNSFDADQKRIFIEDGNFDPMLYFPRDDTEGAELLFPLDEKEDTEIGVPINEYERVGEYDFIVKVPAVLNVLNTQITGEVKAQKLAGKTFTINYI